MRSAAVFRSLLGAGSFVVAGLLFILYPVIRPFSDEVSLQGAAAFASRAWLVAHMMAMVGFTLLPLGLLGMHNALHGTAAEPMAFRALVFGVIGTGLTLPFYGGEAFGLHAIGLAAITQHDAGLVSLAAIVRSGPGLTMFLLGLSVVALSAITTAIALWTSGIYSKWSGLPYAAGFALYIPQFAGTQPIRVAHGALVAAGCLWLGVNLWKTRQLR